MTKKIRLALMVCLTLCLTVFAAAFAACGNSEAGFDGKYRITIKYEDGTAVTGVDVQFCLVSEDGGENCATPVDVDENGYVEVTTSEGTYDIHVRNLKAGEEIVGGTYDAEFNNWFVRTQEGKYTYTITIKTAE